MAIPPDRRALVEELQRYSQDDLLEMVKPRPAACVREAAVYALWASREVESVRDVLKQAALVDPAPRVRKAANKLLKAEQAA